MVTPCNTGRHPPLPAHFTAEGGQAAETAGGPSLFEVLGGSPSPSGTVHAPPRPWVTLLLLTGTSPAAPFSLLLLAPSLCWLFL